MRWIEYRVSCMSVETRPSQNDQMTADNDMAQC